MRSTIVGIGVIMIIMATFIIITSIQVNTNLKDEVYSSLNEAIYQTERVLYDKHGQITSNDQYLEELNTNLEKQLADGRECTVKVYGVDYTKGLLDVQVETTYKNLWGNEIEVSIRRTMIIDEK